MFIEIDLINQIYHPFDAALFQLSYIYVEYVSSTSETTVHIDLFHKKKKIL